MSKRGRVAVIAPDRAAQVAIWVAVLSLCALWPDAYNRWVLSKEIVLLIGVLIAGFAVARGRLPRWFWVIVGVGAGVLVVAALFGENPLAGLFGRFPRYEGLVSIPVYVAAAWLGARLLGPDLPDSSRRALVWAASAASLLIAFVGALEAAGLAPIATNLDRPGSLLGSASDQGIVGAALAVLLLPAVAVAWARRDAMLASVAGVGAAAGVASVMFSTSRAGLLALAVGLVVIVGAGLALTSGAPRRRLAWGAGGLALVVALVAVAVPSMRERLFSLDALAAQTVGDRTYIWGQTLDMLAATPALGVGPSGFLTAFMVDRDADWYAHIAASGTLDSPHNLVLQVAAAGGVLGLACAAVFAVFVGVAGVRGIRSQRRYDLVGAAGAVVAMTVAMLTHFTTPATGILGGMLVGMLVAARARATQSRAWVRWRASLVAVWITALAVTLWGDAQLRAGSQAVLAEDADAAFSRAVAVRPWDVDARSLALQTLVARVDAGDAASLAPALRWSDAALAVLPHDRAVLVAAAVAHRGAGELEQSLALFEQALQLYPNDPLVLSQAGATLLVAGDAGGRAFIERAVEISPDDASVAALWEWAGGSG